MFIKDRIALHQIPEIGFQEFKTTDYLFNQVKDYRCTKEFIGKTGLLLYFDNEQESTIAFRADIDALPIQEQTNLSFQSQHPGFMHACGHDGHMAMLLALANYLNQKTHNLPHNVVLIFQPSEELAGGAQSVIDSGLLTSYNVKAIFGFHLWPGLEKGKIFSKSGEMMAQSSETDIIITGRSSHVATYQEGIDSIEIAARLLTDIYNFDQNIPADTYHLLKFGEIKGGTIRNVIADTVTISGSIRSYQAKTQAYLKRSLEELAVPYRQTYQAKIDFQYIDGYPSVYNDPRLYKAVTDILPSLKKLPVPVLQAEDFGVYGSHYPCTFFFLGLGETPPLHHSNFDFDMMLLAKGIETYQQLLHIKLP